MVILPLNFVVSDVITISVAICKNNLNRFLKLSLIAHLWLLVPVYGWAKYFAIAARISRLSLDLLNEGSSEAKNYYTTPVSLITFLTTGILAIIIPAFVCLLILFGIVFVYGLLEATVFSSTGFSLLDTLNQIDETRAEVILGLVILLLMLLITSLFYGRFFLCDLILMDNSRLGAFQSIRESYRLTKNNPYIFRILIRTFMVVFPIWAVSYLLLTVCIAILLTFLTKMLLLQAKTSDLYLGLYLIAFWLPTANLLSMPLWQTVKATSYYKIVQLHDYDLRKIRRQ